MTSLDKNWMMQVTKYVDFLFKVAKLSHQNRQLAEAMREQEITMKKLSNESADTEATQKELMAIIERIIGSVFRRAGGRPNLAEIAIKIESFLSTVKNYQNKIAIMENTAESDRLHIDELRQKLNSELRNSYAGQRSSPDRQQRGLLGSTAQPGQRLSNQMNSSHSFNKLGKDQDILGRETYSSTRAPMTENPTISMKYRQISPGFSPMEYSRENSANRQGTPERSIYGIRKHYMYMDAQGRNSLANLKTILADIILKSSDPITKEGYAVRKYFVDALLKLESEIDTLCSPSDESPINGNSPSREAIEGRRADVDARNRIVDMGWTPPRSRSKSPYHNKGIFKGGLETMYSPGGELSMVYEDEQELDRYRSEQSKDESRDGAERQDEIRIEEFLSNLGFILKSICRQKKKCREIQKSYSMIDTKVLEMLKFIQRKHPKSDVVGQLSEFLHTSSLAQLSAKIEKLSRIDSLVYKRVMGEFDAVYTKLRERVEDFKRTLDIRRVSLNKIMCKKNIFHN